MHIRVSDYHGNAISLMRKVGYTFQKQVSPQEIAFVRTIGSVGFPRFHVYIKKENNVFILNIHLDQHKETYGEASLHHGEYENDGALKKERERIESLLS